MKQLKKDQLYGKYYRNARRTFLQNPKQNLKEYQENMFSKISLLLFGLNERKLLALQATETAYRDVLQERARLKKERLLEQIKKEESRELKKSRRREKLKQRSADLSRVFKEKVLMFTKSKSR